MKDFKPKKIDLNKIEEKYYRIVTGPADNHSMKASLVELELGEVVGEHSTHNNEELLIFLEGEGIVILKGYSDLDVKEGNSVYIPPQTVHNIKNSGEGRLRYIFIVTKMN